MKLYLATTNNNKIKEILNFIHSFFEVLSSSLDNQQSSKQALLVKNLKNLQNYKSPKEHGISFRENANIKSQSLLNYLIDKNQLETPLGILAEDSGLEVKALNGDPGIFSARYSGLTANNQKNNKYLIENLKNQKNRKARYVCALSFLFLSGGKKVSKTFEAYCKGEIAYQEKGRGGFGYDPLFIPKGETKTFGELPFPIETANITPKSCFEKMEKIFRKGIFILILFQAFQFFII